MELLSNFKAVIGRTKIQIEVLSIAAFVLKRILSSDRYLWDSVIGHMHKM